MKTKKQVISEWPEYRALINAVINNIGLESVEDVNRHGIGGGFGGFIFYSDTHAFAMRYRRYIVPMLENMAAELGEDVINMVEGFNCINSPMDATSAKIYISISEAAGPNKGQLPMLWHGLPLRKFVECSKIRRDRP